VKQQWPRDSFERCQTCICGCLHCNESYSQAFGQKEFLEFANLFIEGTHWKKEMHDFKVKQGWKPKAGKEGKACLGLRYYKSFLKHHQKVLQSKKPRKFPRDLKNG
jgi:hypothetical protein